MSLVRKRILADRALAKAAESSKRTIPLLKRSSFVQGFELAFIKEDIENTKELITAQKSAADEIKREFDKLGGETVINLQTRFELSEDYNEFIRCIQANKEWLSTLEDLLKRSQERWEDLNK